jgi:hypothetical protein
MAYSMVCCSGGGRQDDPAAAPLGLEPLDLPGRRLTADSWAGTTINLQLILGETHGPCTYDETHGPWSGFARFVLLGADGWDAAASLQEESAVQVQGGKGK